VKALKPLKLVEKVRGGCMGSYNIGSFNTHFFSGVGKHNLDTFAKIVCDESLDIIALQEITREEALTSLLRRLPQYWKGKQKSPPSFKPEEDDTTLEEGEVQSKERKHSSLGYAFLWNTNRFRECSKDKEPEIFNHIKKGTLARTPYYGRFTPSELPGGAFFEIRLINIHLWWGSNNAVDVGLRLKEYEIVTGDVHTYVSKHRYGNNMPAYTIIMGDYNLTLPFLGKNIIQKENIAVITEQSDPTTLSKKCFVNDYDHFSYDINRFSESGITVNISRINSVENYCGNDFEKHKLNVSDHVPIKIEFSLY
jgi:endonuclease/exonuclease/phosphatase family metal-dependent hydrolase